jgi:aminoglycoside phosphotransferase (APT) family kinase protein
MAKNFHVASKQDLKVIIRKTFNAEVEEVLPLTQGYANEVYLVKTSKNQEVIVRIRQRGPTNFEQEAWAMSQAESLGVPMPTIYEVGQFEISRELRDVMVMQKSDGQALSELSNLNSLQRQSIYRQFGLILNKLHSESLKGFGFLKANGVCEFDDKQRFVVANLRYREEDVPYLIKAGLAEAEALALLSIVNGMKASNDQLSVLCHGDLSLEHIFVDNDLNITAFIDWGMCQGGSRALDIAVLLMYHPDIELSWILQGYEAVNDVDMFKREMLIQQVNVAMSFLGHGMREGDVDYKEIAVQGMRLMLRNWQTL